MLRFGFVMVTACVTHTSYTDAIEILKKAEAGGRTFSKQVEWGELALVLTMMTCTNRS
jgi:hypothetical protein